MNDIEDIKKKLSGDRVTVGMATCGLSAGAGAVFDALRSAGIPAERVGCNGMCYNEPIVTVVNDGVRSIYAKVTKDNVNILIDAIKSGKRCKELFLADSLEKIPFYKYQVRLMMENCGHINPNEIEHYMAVGGYTGLLRAVEMGREGVIDEIKKSGLRGRGGAGFPTAVKWGFIAKKSGKKYLIGNGDEGNPGAFMNRTLMESDPFKIIEGMTIAAFATGCSEGFIYTRAEYPLAIETLTKAIEQAYKKKLLGKEILGISGFDFELSIRKGAGAFVCGEETALIHSIEGKRGSPTPRPPFPADKGVYGKPSNVNNVGTLGHVSTILKYGYDAYANIGTEKSKGTKVICLTGKIRRPGIIEVPMGTKLKDIVYKIAGGLQKGSKFKAILSGGPAGGCIPYSKLNTPFDYETMRELGAIMGSGGLVVISDSSCIVDIARYFMGFTQEESCGKCTPCREGTKRMLEMLIRITDGSADIEEFKKLKVLAEFVRDNALCGLGQAAPNPVLSTIRYFEKEYLSHIKDNVCPSGICVHLIRYDITDKCIGCGACARVCPSDAIIGKPKEKYMIVQRKCIKCGSCYAVCPVKAIEKK